MKNFSKSCITGLILFLIVSPALAGGPRESALNFVPNVQLIRVDDLDGTRVIPARHEKIINMLEFMIPPLKWSDANQFHLEGYMQCLGGECQKNGDPVYLRGVFHQKQYLAPPDERGNLLFTTSKSTTGLLGHPCEYYQSREGYDEEGNPITRLYIYAEMMDWVGNSQYRAYFDGMGEPFFEIGRSSVVEGKAYIQNPRSGTDYYCSGATNTYPLMDSVYVVYSYKLTRDTIEQVNARLGNMGSIEPKWIDMSESMGVKDPELMVVVNYWGYAGFSADMDPRHWWQSELYLYLKGVGWVSWRWMDHEKGDLNKPFVVTKLGNMDTIVPEEPGKVIRNVELCEPIR